MKSSFATTIRSARSALGIILIALLSLLPATLRGQPQKFDTRGTDFWLTFMPNFHNFDGPGSTDSLFIFINADEPTNGRIEFMDNSGQVYTEDFSITDPTQMYVFKTRYKLQTSDRLIELLGYNKSGTMSWQRNQDEVIARQSFHVTSDKEVTVYALSQAVTTSDAFLVLPTDVLGTFYTVMAYNSDGRLSLDDSRTPSQFAVVASEDNTEVTIAPRDSTYANNLDTQNIVMNRGDVYLVQAKITSYDKFSDLTGSTVKSTKPVAVFGGHQRAFVPYKNNSFYNASRDFLAEEIPPVATWGQNAFLIPYNQPASIIEGADDVFRIMAAYNNTTVTINNVKTIYLDAGDYYENSLITPAIVSADAPILVAQFKRTAGNGTSDEISDPFMMLIPPKEQFKESYRIINIQCFETDDMNRKKKVYLLQYVAVVVPKTAVSSVKIDGKAVNGGFIQIPNSQYAFANVQVTDGVHFVSADEPIGVYVYGYGYANSYGYVGGMSMRSFDFKPPEILLSQDCYKVTGTVTDSAETDTKLREVVVPAASLDNVNVYIDSFTPLVKLVKFNAQLVNKRKDGKFTIQATDSAGTTSSSDVDIPGFTLFLKDQQFADTLKVYNGFVRPGNVTCFLVDISNYGRFPQQLKDVYLKSSGEFIVEKPLPDIIQPGEVKSIKVCFSTDLDSVYIDTVFVQGKCGTVPVMAVNMISSGDRSKPGISKASSDCDSLHILTITDSTVIDAGIASVDVLESVNCTVGFDVRSVNICKLSVRITDPYQDAWYGVEAADSAGNKSVIRDTIPGFTVSFSDIDSDGNKGSTLDHGGHFIGSVNCDSVVIRNYGLHSITFATAYLARNVMFSLPQSQFPLTIAPGDSARLMICFRPLTSGDEELKDTLNLLFGCYKRSLNLIGKGQPLSSTSMSNCNVPLQLVTSKVPQDYFIDNAYPNPVTKTGKIRIGMADKGDVTMNIFDMLGNTRKVIAAGNCPAGVIELEFDTAGLSQGAYLMEVTVNGQRMTGYFVVQN